MPTRKQALAHRYTYGMAHAKPRGHCVPTLPGQVDLQITGKTLVIEALKSPRAGWFDALADEAEVPDEAILDTIPVDEGDDEWVW